MEEFRRFIDVTINTIWKNTGVFVYGGDNITMHPKDIGADVLNWMDLSQDTDYYRALKDVSA